MAAISFADLRTAFRGLAYHAPDMAADFVQAQARANLAHLPGATERDWDRYLEAVTNHWDVKDGGDVPDSYLDDTLRRLPRCEVRPIVLDLLERDRDELLDTLMGFYSKLRAVS